MSNKISLTFCGGVEEVTGANFLFELEEGDRVHRVLIDCGLTQGTESMEAKNSNPFPYDPTQIDFLFVTHAHMDHIGRVPQLVKEGFRGRIMSTGETKELALPMLEDALRLLEEDSRRKGILPLYEKKDVENALSLWEGVPYETSREIFTGVFVTARDAGHILGSAMFEFSIDSKIYSNGNHEKIRVLFTGDLGNSPSPLLKDTERVKGINYMIMESVYGDRNHESRHLRRELLKEAILESIKKKGTLLIPSFSLEKTQVLLYEMNYLVEKGEVPAVPVFLDSPLAIKITEIYKRNHKNFNEEARRAIEGGDDILRFPKLKFTPSRMQSEMIATTPNPKIIIAGGGMSTGGRITKHERMYLGGRENTILFIGYQSAGSLGRQIEEGVDRVQIDGEEVIVRAKVVTIIGYSSHKDLDHLVEFVEYSADTLKKVFVVMGEPKASMFLAQRIKDYIGVEAIHPEEGETIELS
ncbi:MAG: hypothetical protein A3H57_00515 [Candidatus Taylorbacteria bacterium RIFCSPLOWO2_02_FULL_43_11]|uniref:MBL fold hydrolase n=1 Tax=Candidatus Taylorbacteria bacterium RIFCSPHIGHO2_02_FULL_43_32b TaxID=1802306 RepID=A0A1G2MMU1_9BACT|nr:MAG: hypothetical protein A2743_02775 [Candidatus Taylorbacteria bacterium RIFCSPHIGHO2_01_FULL_43_47]OHA25054.1 MAG: hypothetical protein A3C72_03915 [Candidatus Taylorbacteria bacterium RIFCSPHIGHO2_02_FULL_43_32b]OHA31924.1 MAG: hypothetical protein A3B08_02415 [Candidatus Taylorbacteria bacterium RIFCSPLOWO2_01_FULL_43_44]OHA35776.1 MAG: hypothetical protein A3H57_00515 [Candidatus Taylorbacteria bacterium RIFCSPLOWO2_02_FULL_43_11]